jgi:hypothetical protein
MPQLADKELKSTIETIEKPDIAYYLMLAASWWLGSFLVLCLLNINKLFNLLTNAAQGPERFFNDALNGAFDSFTSLLDRIPAVSSLVTFLFWVLVGIAVYCVILAGAGFIGALGKEHSLLQHYKLPFKQKKSSLIRYYLVNWILVIGLLIVLIFLGIITLFMIVPTASGLFMNAVYDPTNLSAWVSTLNSVSLVALSSYMTFWLARTFWRARSLLI